MKNLKMLSLLVSISLILSCSDSNEANKSIDELTFYREKVDFSSFYNSQLPVQLGSIKLEEAKATTSSHGDQYFVAPIKQEGQVRGAAYSTMKPDGSFVSLYVSSAETKNSDGWYHFYDENINVFKSAKFENKNLIQFRDADIQGRTQSCMGNCYAFVMDACQADNDCRILCDGLNIFGICSAEVIIACAIHCLAQEF